MNNALKKHSRYFISYIIFLVIYATAILLFDKETIHLFINGFNNEFFDLFFKYATCLGDGVIVLISVLVLLFISKRMALLVALSGITSGLVVQFLKLIFFNAIARPHAFFEELGIHLHYVEGVEMHSFDSFPSGHAAAISALITSLVLIQKTKKFDVFFIVLALTIAFSRVYLSQHFLIDIFFGSIIGVSIALITYLFIYSSRGMTNKKLDAPLIYFFTKKN